MPRDMQVLQFAEPLDHRQAEKKENRESRKPGRDDA